MVWTYHSVKQLRKKYENDEEISIEEKRKLEKYIREKKKTVDRAQGEWCKTQLTRAEFLFHKIQKESQTVEVQQ